MELCYNIVSEGVVGEGSVETSNEDIFSVN